MRTEQDLQRALRAFEADNVPDTTAVRARLDSALAGQSTPQRNVGAAVVAPNHWKQRAVGAVAAAACIGAVFAGGKVIESHRGAPADGPSVSVAPTNPAPTASPTAKPTQEAPQPVSFLLGARHIGSFSGTGTTRIALPDFVVPKYFRATVTFSCRNGSIHSISDSTTKPGEAMTFYPAKTSNSCAGETSISPKSRWVRLTFRGTAVWQMSFDLVPDLRTNAIVFNSDSGRLTGEFAAGRGTKTVVLPKRGSAGVGVLELRCSGAGVTFSSSDKRISGFYTHTCARGATYSFQVDGQGLAPRTFTVHASASTTWQLGV